MWTHVKKSMLVAAVALCMLQSTHGIMVKITNMCADEFELAHVGNKVVISNEKFVPGSTMNKEIPTNSASHVFKAGRGAQATLAEISQRDGKVWYDISIIPTGNGVGPGNCRSLGECKQRTGGTGFNKPMQIIPKGPGGLRFPGCKTLTCMNDGCTDAYLFPDDIKTHVCPGDMDLDVVFCPGGPGGKTPAPTPEPTPAPTPTPPPTTVTPPPIAANESSTITFEGGFLGGSNSGNGAPGAVGGEERSLDLGEERAVTEAPTSAPATDAPAVAVAAPQTEVATEINNKASQEQSTGATVYVLLSVGAAAMVAGSAIFVLRKKKQQLEALDGKSPLPTTTAAATAFMLATPKDTTIL